MKQKCFFSARNFLISARNFQNRMSAIIAN